MLRLRKKANSEWRVAKREICFFPTPPFAIRYFAIRPHQTLRRRSNITSSAHRALPPPQRPSQVPAPPRPETRRSSRCSRHSRFRSRLELFRVARRRHDGDERRIDALDHAQGRGQRDVAQVLRIVDLKARDIDLDRFRNLLRRALHLDRVGLDIDRAAALHAR
jgi:hypothetical protein